MFALPVNVPGLNDAVILRSGLLSVNVMNPPLRPTTPVPESVNLSLQRVYTYWPVCVLNLNVSPVWSSCMQPLSAVTVTVKLHVPVRFRESVAETLTVVTPAGNA